MGNPFASVLFGILCTFAGIILFPVLMSFSAHTAGGYFAGIIVAGLIFIMGIVLIIAGLTGRSNVK